MLCFVFRLFKSWFLVFLGVAGLSPIIVMFLHEERPTYRTDIEDGRGPLSLSDIPAAAADAEGHTLMRALRGQSIHGFPLSMKIEC